MAIKFAITHGINGRGILDRGFNENETLKQVLNLQTGDTYNIDRYVDGNSGFYYKPSSYNVGNRIYQLDAADLSAQLLLFVIETDS